MEWAMDGKGTEGERKEGGGKGEEGKGMKNGGDLGEWQGGIERGD